MFLPLRLLWNPPYEELPPNPPPPPNMFQCLSWILTILLVLLSVAFFTLFERKVIGLVHFRLGPNKVSYLGLLQPLLDAFKLLSKFYSLPLSSNSVPLYLSPVISLVLSLVLWVTVPTLYRGISADFSLLLFLCLTSLLVFPLLVRGWASNSKYSFIGCLRAIAQSISYEAVFSTLLVLLTLFFTTYRAKSAALFDFVGVLVLLPLWAFCALAESHRAPFDFSERESELVSGFNTEYRGGLFAFIFLSEYCVLLVGSFMISWLFFHWLRHGNPILVVLLALLVLLFFVIVRVTYCRFRYDLLMIAAWKTCLPLALCFILLLIPLI